VKPPKPPAFHKSKTNTPPPPPLPPPLPRNHPQPPFPLPSVATSSVSGASLSPVQALKFMNSSTQLLPSLAALKASSSPAPQMADPVGSAMWNSSQKKTWRGLWRRTEKKLDLDM